MLQLLCVVFIVVKNLYFYCCRRHIFIFFNLKKIFIYLTTVMVSDATDGVNGDEGVGVIENDIEDENLEGEG